MSTYISPLAQVDPKAQLGTNVHVGPFSLIGPDVILGDDCTLDSHVVLTGNTTIGNNNRFWPNAVIGGEPQDYTYTVGAPTQVVIGNDNEFREGVTVNRGAEKEDGITSIGDECLLMSNAHVAHNCCVGNKVMLVNGILLGGHVHVHDRAIVSGNTVVHHFTTVGTLSFVSGGGKVVTDVPPYMMVAGNDDNKVRTINAVGMKRAGVSLDAIKLIKQAYKLLIREHKKLDVVKQIFAEQLGETFPIELMTLLDAMQKQKEGSMGRAREVFRSAPYTGKRAA
ncbi:UNVERIFIED_CONTAM: hypothetical protein GTU68_014672 [Idotea baltica]|nr:hypothetical protein [Idotea baltica]